MSPSLHLFHEYCRAHTLCQSRPRQKLSRPVDEIELEGPGRVLMAGAKTTSVSDKESLGRVSVLASRTDCSGCLMNEQRIANAHSVYSQETASPN